MDRPERSAGSEESGIEESAAPQDPGGREETRPPPSQADVEAEVCREILSILKQSYGKGAASAQAFVTDDWVAVVLDEVELLPNEEFLVSSGERDVVAHVRTRYQHAIQGTFRAAIERATGRRVIGFASANSVEEPRFMAEIFKLE